MCYKSGKKISLTLRSEMDHWVTVDQLVVQLSMNPRVSGSIRVPPGHTLRCPWTRPHSGAIICVQQCNNSFPVGIMIIIITEGKQLAPLCIQSFIMNQDFFFWCCMNQSQGTMSSWSWSITHWSFLAPSINSSKEIWPSKGNRMRHKVYLTLCAAR